MKISIETIPAAEQRYPTCGDWFRSAEGTLEIRVSSLPAESFEFLVALHELIEAYLCRSRGVSEQDVTAFDEDFERRRAFGNEAEPGDDPDAPYRREHFFATTIERLVAAELGVDWNDYDRAVQES